MKVGVIMGGISSEREISIQSGNSVVHALDKDKYEAIPIVLNEKEDLIEKVKGIDFALLALHGKFGEDGTVQSVLKTLGIPFSGCGPLSSAICMDKDMTKRILAFGNVRTARWVMVSSVDEIDYEKIENLCYPVFIKPNNGGSSVATTLVESKEAVKDAVLEALKYDTEVMIEEYIKGDEITCPVFENEMFPVLAIKAKTDFYDYEQKYSANGAEHYAINLEKDIHSEVEKMALDTYKALKCSVYARIDMIITEEGVPYVLEVNTLPGMTATSLFPQSAGEKGYSEFIDMIIEHSLKK